MMKKVATLKSVITFGQYAWSIIRFKCVQHTLTTAKRASVVDDIFNRIIEQDGIPKNPTNFEILFNTGKTDDETFDVKMAALSIVDKTEGMLQSVHPVRFIMDREIRNLRSSLNKATSYYNWVTLFGRSVFHSKYTKEEFDRIIYYTACCAESGMFSTDVHQTVVNIPVNLYSEDLQAKYNVGNKYAVLIGDYFTIRGIFVAQKTKENKVLLCITKGVEEFVSSEFECNLINETQTVYPFVLSSQAKVQDWKQYNTRLAGYFRAGLTAIYDIMLDEKDRTCPEALKNFEKFSTNLSLMIKGIIELEDLEVDDPQMPTPFAFISLPAVLYQMQNPRAFDPLRKASSDQTSLVRQLRSHLRSREIIDEANHVIKECGKKASDALKRLSKDRFYMTSMSDLIEALTTS